MRAQKSAAATKATTNTPLEAAVCFTGLASAPPTAMDISDLPDTVFAQTSTGVPAIANVFGRVVGNVQPFYDMSRRLHSDGYKLIEIRRVE